MQNTMWKQSRLWVTRWQRPLKIAGSVAGALFFALFIWLVVRAVHEEGYSVSTLLSQIGLPTLAGIALLYTLALVVTVWAWGAILGQIAPPVSWRSHWYIYTTTNVTKRLPGSLWHVAGRAVLYHQRGVTGRAVAVASGLEVLLMMISGAVIVLLAWPVLATRFDSGYQSAILIAALLFAGLFLFHPGTWRRLRKWSGVAEGKQPALSWRHGLQWMAAYVLSWLFGGLTVTLLANAFHPIPVAAWPGVAASWVLAYMLGLFITILPSGLGVSDISLTVLLAGYMPAPLAALVAIAARLLFTLLELLWGLISWAGQRLSERIPHK